MGLRTWTQPVCRILISSWRFQPSWWETRTDVLPWPRRRHTSGQSSRSTGTVVSIVRPHYFSLPAQVPTPSLNPRPPCLGVVEKVRLCAGLLLSNKSQVRGQLAPHLIIVLCPPLPEHLAQSQHVGLSEYLTDGLGSHKGSPEPPPGSSLGTPIPSWEWSSARRGSLSLKPKAPSHPAPSRWPRTGPLLPGLCLGCEKYHSCSCSGRDLGEKEKKVHQGKSGSCRSFSLGPSTCFSRLHNQSKTPCLLTARPLGASLCSFSFPSSLSSLLLQVLLSILTPQSAILCSLLLYPTFLGRDRDVCSAPGPGGGEGRRHTIR